MKILQLPSWYLPEGGYFCLHQSEALHQAGVEVHILANVMLPWRKYRWKVFSYPFKPFFTNEYGIPILRYYSWRIPFVGSLNTDKWVRDTVSLYAKFEKRNGRPDFIQVHSCMWAGLAAAVIKEKYGVPYVITEHRGIFGAISNYAKQMLRPEFSISISKAFSNANLIIPVSSQLVPKIKEYCGKEDVPIRVIPNMLDTDFFTYKERKLSNKEPFVFVAVNGFNAYKGYEYLLPAFDLLCEKNSNVHLRLVGENFEFAEFQTLLANTKHKDKISFAGELDRTGVRSELWNAHAFVISSIVEAQSVSTIEAMSTGLPVVSTIVNPIEILTEKCGYRISIEDDAALADAMLKMINNYSQFDSAYISQHTKALVSKETVLQQLLEAYTTFFKS